MTDDAVTGVLGALRAHGLLADDPVVSVTTHHQRSLCFRIVPARGRGLFVKQAQPTADGGQTADVAGEGAALRLLSNLPGLAPLLPEVVAVDAARRLLVLRDLAGSVPLHVLRRQGGAPGETLHVMAALGTALARVHAVHDRPGLAQVDHARAVARSWTRLSPRLVTQFPAGYRELAVRLRSVGLLDALDDLAASRPEDRSADRLLHGDVKSDNVLWSPVARRVHLVDWEGSGFGDPRWDLGSLLGDLLHDWLCDVDLGTGGPLTRQLAAAGPGLLQVQAQWQTFLQAYAAAGGAVLDESDLAVCVRHAGMALLTRLTATAMHAARLDVRALALLQVCGQLLRTPDRAVAVLR